MPIGFRLHAAEMWAVDESRHISISEGERPWPLTPPEKCARSRTPNPGWPETGVGGQSHPPSGRKAERLSCHVVPKSLGGTITVNACQLCNRAKRDLSVDEYRSKVGGGLFYGEGGDERPRPL